MPKIESLIYLLEQRKAFMSEEGPQLTLLNICPGNTNAINIYYVCMCICVYDRTCGLMFQRFMGTCMYRYIGVLVHVETRGQL